MYTPLLQSLNSPTHGASTSPAASSSTSSSSTDAVNLTNTFLQLLTVQLKNQSPLNPLDPNAFVAQLAQFDSLGELTQIQQLMQTLVNDVTLPHVANAGAGANSVSSPSLTSSTR